MSGGPFSSLDIAKTGMGFAHYWEETIAHNIANINTTTRTSDQPFRARMVVAQPIDPSAASGGGVAVGAILQQQGDAPLEFAPDNPLANADGYVQGAVDDLSGQMSDLILAARAYQANITMQKEARESLESATTLGKA
jgi:flagellar basal-body rod protein FlgC